MPLNPKTQSSLASFKSRLVLPFWYRFIQVVLEKRPLNRCSSSSCAVNKAELTQKFGEAVDKLGDCGAAAEASVGARDLTAEVPQSLADHSSQLPVRPTHLL